MQRHAHHSRLLAAVGMERIELVQHRALILLAGIAFPHVERNVVDLSAVRDRKHLSRFDFHGVGLIVVVPVAGHAAARARISVSS